MLEVTQPKRIGGEISLGTDRIGSPNEWQSYWLAFSNGRAAIAWLLDQAEYQSISVCAYTCPKLVAFLRRRNLDVRLYDVGDEPPRADWAIIPALFGSQPWCEYRGRTIIDAAQTAFGHMDFKLPKMGAVLSCPRKCTELADGAVLAMSNDGAAFGSDLPVAEAAAYKTVARAIWSLGDDAQAVTWNDLAEAKWPDTPHRMSEASFTMLQRLDQKWHVYKRWENLAELCEKLSGKVPFWRFDQCTPFSLPIFVANPTEVIAAAKRRRIYLTRLWPNTSHYAAAHRAAAWMAMHLVSLPVDQRHDVNDMERLADVVLSVAEPPSVRPPQKLKRFLG